MPLKVRLQKRKPSEVCEALVEVLERSGVSETAPSIGIPIVMPDGKTILRGPRINVPRLVGHKKNCFYVRFKGSRKMDSQRLDRSSTQKYIHMAKSISKMLFARAQLRDMGSASASIYTFIGDSFEIGEVVAWIFNNEMGGYRMK